MRRLFQKLIFLVLANAVALYVVQLILEDRGFVVTGGIIGFAAVGLVLGVFNTFLRPFLKIIGFPLMILSLGLFSVIINAVILFFAEYFFNTLLADTLAVQFTVGEGLGTYLIAAVLLAVVNTLTGWLFRS